MRELALTLSAPVPDGTALLLNTTDPMHGLRRVALGLCLVAGFLGMPWASCSRSGQAGPACRSGPRRRERRRRPRDLREAVWSTNDFGDRLIVSIVHVAVDETMKGDVQPTLDVDVEGGTIGTLTLRVSDEQSFAPG